MISLHALLLLTQDFASICSQAAGKREANIGQKSFYVPDSLTVVCGSLLFHKESPINIFFASSYNSSGDRGKLSECISRYSLKFTTCFLVWA